MAKIKALDKIIARLKEYGIEYTSVSSPVWQSLRAIENADEKYRIHNLNYDRIYNDRNEVMDKLKALGVNACHTHSNFKGYTIWVEVEGSRITIPAISKIVEFNAEGQFVRAYYSESEYSPKSYRHCTTPIGDIMNALECKSPARIAQIKVDKLEMEQKDLRDAEEAIEEYERKMQALKNTLLLIINDQGLHITDKVNKITSTMKLPFFAPDFDSPARIKEEIEKIKNS